jgi:hypothetical protein
VCAAQVINDLIAQYAMIAKEHRQCVHAQDIASKPVKAAFRCFLQ